jgi:UDP-2-acetamido-2,6-beta-L-arabino-hexul-4-ose reductase
MEALGRNQNVRAIGYDLGVPDSELDKALAQADIVFHLAGVNRPQNVDEFKQGNTGFTEQICAKLEAMKRIPMVVMSSSIQAELDNPYGISKRMAEKALMSWAERTGASAVVFRLKNVFGKWCRPNYNSVTATFCHNIAHGLPVSISDPTRELELVYIDDVVNAFLSVLEERGQRSEVRGQIPARSEFRSVERSFKITLGDLAAKIRSFRESRTTLMLPHMDDALTRCLYATYLSYLDGPDFAYGLEIKTDNRGCLAEFMKSAQFGQIFVSRTKPGITRGNHYHHTKTEKFMVVEGEAVIRFRNIQNGDVIEHKVNGRDFRVVDIPPGYTHSIENVGITEMVVLFWASEIFDPSHPDTYFKNVI